jgi:DNA polymerase V
MVQEDRKQIVSSKSFGRPVYKLDELKEAVANYATRACEKLRRQKSACHVLSVFVQTNRFKDIAQYYNSATVKMGTGTASTTRLIAAANGALETIFRDGIEYKKAGVILSDLRAESAVEFSLFDDQKKYAQDTKAMNVMDAINARMGRDTLKVGACGNANASTNVNARSAANKDVPAWSMKATMRTPCYTTRWQDLLKVC